MQEEFAALVAISSNDEFERTVAIQSKTSLAVEKKKGRNDIVDVSFHVASYIGNFIINVSNLRDENFGLSPFISKLDHF